MSIEHVCLSVRLSVSVCPLANPTNHAAELHLIFCAYCLWPWRCCDTLSTSGFVDDVMFSYNGSYGGVMLPQQPRYYVEYGLTPLLSGIGCILS